MKLDLRAPLVYAQIVDLPVDMTEKDEFLSCYELDPVQGLSIEPDRDRLLGPLLFHGRLNSGGKSGLTVSLPEGEYLFVQCRSALTRDEWLDLAIEQQKDGLWEIYKPTNRLYVRYLYEDGRPVTQLFRAL